MALETAEGYLSAARQWVANDRRSIRGATSPSRTPARAAVVCKRRRMLWAERREDRMIRPPLRIRWKSGPSFGPRIASQGLRRAVICRSDPRGPLTAELADDPNESGAVCGERRHIERGRLRPPEAEAI